jgi:hypothetical protein
MVINYYLFQKLNGVKKMPPFNVQSMMLITLLLLGKIVFTVFAWHSNSTVEALV